MTISLKSNLTFGQEMADGSHSYMTFTLQPPSRSSCTARQGWGRTKMAHNEDLGQAGHKPPLKKHIIFVFSGQHP